MTTRASYRKGIAWIAINDEPMEIDPFVVCDMISVLLLAELFGKDQLQVAADVISFRKKGY